MFAGIVSQNHTRTCWVLKCDIKKFFHSINQEKLIIILQQYIPDKRILNILEEIIHSFHSAELGFGLPLGNLTSQLFANIYMNELDQFIKHKLKIKHYIRYADDFVVLSESREYLHKQIKLIDSFLKQELSLHLHPHKITIRTYASGVDFLGWVNFSDHRVIRNKTKRRMLKNLKTNKNDKSLSSSLGLLNHGNTAKVKKGIIKSYIFN